MLVKDLIEKLQQFNPESTLDFVCSIESGRSVSVSDDCTMSLEWDGELDGVVLELNGEETDWD